MPRALGLGGIARLAALCALALGLAVGATAAAATLEVGAGKPFATLSAAAAAAHDGDRVVIGPGTYVDCAVWRASNLTIEGAGPDATVIAEKTCREQALFVIDGNNVTVRNLTLARARAPSANGAGIRAEGGNLTVEHVRFLDNENGILAAPNPLATILIRDSAFIGNGSCASSFGCAHGIYVNRVKKLRAERSTFLATRAGHHIKSRALRTEILGCRIEDGPDGTASYSVDVPNGGALLLRDSTIEKGPKSQNQGAAVAIGEEGASNPAGEILVARNVFRVDGGYASVLVSNATTTPARLVGNRLLGTAQALRGPGSVQ